MAEAKYYQARVWHAQQIQVAWSGKTALSTVMGKEGAGLTYRGYDIKDLAAQCNLKKSPI